MNRNAGFSLVELSIVLVILGLLTGGILAGQSLIRAAELRSVTSEYQRYITAIQTFRDKYMAVPGDFRDATRFWGRHENVGTCVTNSAAGVTSPGTCDGNGNGTLQHASANSTSGESFQIWNQLARAGLIEGSYSGYTSPSRTFGAMVGINVPSARIGANTVWVAANNSLNGAGSFFSAPDNYLSIGGANAAGTTDADGMILKAEEAWGIDSKLDDGIPSYGRIQTYTNAMRPNCATTSVASTAAYALTNSAVGCNLFFPRAF